MFVSGVEPYIEFSKRIWSFYVYFKIHSKIAILFENLLDFSLVLLGFPRWSWVDSVVGVLKRRFSDMVNLSQFLFYLGGKVHPHSTGLKAMLSVGVKLVCVTQFRGVILALK